MLLEVLFNEIMNWLRELSLFDKDDDDDVNTTLLFVVLFKAYLCPALKPNTEVDVNVDIGICDDDTDDEDENPADDDDVKCCVDTDCVLIITGCVLWFVIDRPVILIESFDEDGDELADDDEEEEEEGTGDGGGEEIDDVDDDDDDDDDVWIVDTSTTFLTSIVVLTGLTHVRFASFSSSESAKFELETAAISLLILFWLPFVNSSKFNIKRDFGISSILL